MQDQKTWKDLSKADKIVMAVFVALFLAYSTGLYYSTKNAQTVNTNLVKNCSSKTR